MPQKIADEVGVHRTTVYRWIADWKDALKRYTLYGAANSGHGGCFDAHCRPGKAAG